jgi:hypothetical protein
VLGERVDRDEGCVGHEFMILARGGEKTGAGALAASVSL